MRKSDNNWVIVLCALFISFLLAILNISRAEKASAVNTRATTTVTVIVVCGDGVKDPEEVCDKGNPPAIPADFGTSTCQDFGWDAGELSCSDDCAQILDTMCYTCGNGTKEQAEECDGADFGGATCLTFGYNSGTLSCTIQCRINLMNCTSVGTAPGSTSGGAIGGGGSTGGGGAGFDIGRDTPLAGTKVIIKGTAYPESDVHILKDGAMLGIAKADANADFSYENSAIAPGVVNFGFWSEDKNNLKSPVYNLTFRVSSNAVTTITGVYIPPTIGADKITLKHGEDITIFGTAIPYTDMYVEIYSDTPVSRQLTSDDDGEWSLLFNTSELEKDVSHFAKAYFQKTAGSISIKSGFSSAVNFYLGDVPSETACPGADLNKDGKVNLTDFSILLYYWGTNDACADQNKNGRVELADFSIMMFNWTG